MKSIFSIINIIKFSFHFIITSIVFYYFFILTWKIVLLINPNENLILTFIYSVLIFGILNFTVLRFVVMTIIAGLFNYFDFEKLNIIKFTTYISCLIIASYTFIIKREITKDYIQNDTIYIGYALLVFSTLKFITKVHKVTLNLKAITAENYILSIDNGIITPYQAIEQIKYNSHITNQKRFEIIEVLKIKYKEILEEGDRNHEILLDYYRKNKDKYQ